MITLDSTFLVTIFASFGKTASSNTAGLEALFGSFPKGNSSWAAEKPNEREL